MICGHLRHLRMLPLPGAAFSVSFAMVNKRMKAFRIFPNRFEIRLIRLRLRTPPLRKSRAHDFHFRVRQRGRQSAKPD